MPRLGLFKQRPNTDVAPISEAPENDNAIRTLRSFKNAFAATAAEFLFVLFPLMVLAFVFLITTKPQESSLLATPEWSFGAAVLFGQAVQKITAAASARAQAYPWQKTTLLVSVFLIFGLVPSLVTLALLIHEASTKPLAYCQVGLFILGSVSFLSVGTVSHYLLFEEKPRAGREEPEDA